MYSRALFKRKKTAAVFVDFEHWCYSLDRLYRMKPQIEDFYIQIAGKYNIKRIYFFGDFSEPKLQCCLNDIRTITNTVIDTHNPSPYNKKDFTDFIMLDFIYQDIDNHPRTNTYIIFSGDGHFSSVTRYLKIQKNKHVIIYGITNATSNKLKSIADKVIQIPVNETEIFNHQKLIIENMNYVFNRANSRIIYPTFNSTIQTVAQQNNISPELIQFALEDLIYKGIVYKENVKPTPMSQIKVLRVNWDLAAQAALWKYDETTSN